MKRFILSLILLATVLLTSCAQADITIARGQESAENAFPKTESAVALTVNISSGTFHLDKKCRYAVNMKEENRKTIFYSDINSALADGYKPCSACAPEYKNTEEYHD